MPRIVRLLVILVAMPLCLAGTARADWPAGGKRVMVVDASFNGVLMGRVFALPSGEFYVLGVGTGGGAYGYSVQRLTPGGDFAPGWPSSGLALDEASKADLPMKQGFVVDDTTALWRANNGLQSPARPTARLIRPEPLVMPQWPATSTTGSAPGYAAAPAPGGCYIALGSKVQRMTRSGIVAPGWPANGVNGVNSVGPALVGDGADGAVVFGAGAGGLPTAKRFDPTGVLHAGWPAAGRVLTSDASDVNADFDATNQLVRSGSDHFIAGWVSPYSSPIKHLKLQRFSKDGMLDLDWPSDGLTAIEPDTITGVTVLPDGLGGVHVLWYAHRRAFGTHVNPDGSFQAIATDLAAGDATFQLPRALAPTPYVVADSAPAGGLLFAYDDFGSGATTPHYHVRWLLADYTPGPSEPAPGRLVTPAERGRGVRLVHADGIGGAYLGWEGAPEDPNAFPPPYFELWMTRLLPSSLVGAPGPARVQSVRLGRPSPNPARDAAVLSVTLPDDEPARLTLHDVAGREVRSIELRGAGEHTVRLEDLDALPVGLYLARIRHPRGVVGTRVVVAR